MLFKKIVVLSFADKDNYLVETISYSSKKADIKKSQQYSLDVDLNKLFNQIKKDFNTNSIRVLLPENKSYSLFSFISKKETLNREIALSIAKNSIPENIDNISFDYKILKENKENYEIQIIAANSSLINSFLEASQKNNLKIESFEPVSIALARLSSNETQAHLIKYKKLFVAAFKGTVYGVSLNEKDKLKEYVKRNYNLELVKTIDNLSKPSLGLAIKPDLKGSDPQVLNINNQLNSSKKTKNKNILLIFFILISFSFLVLFWFFYFKKNKSTNIIPEITDNSSDSISKLTQVPSPTSIILNRSQVKIQLLNGSGISGQVSKVKDFLEDLGYKDISTGNAGSYDYTDTIISTNNNAKEYISLLTLDLNYSYTINTNNQNHDSNSAFDIIIIIGQPKNE